MFILFEAILALPLIAMLVLSGGVIAFFGAIYTFKERHLFSFFWTLLAVAAVVYAFFPAVSAFGSGFLLPDHTLDVRSIGMFALKFGAIWLVFAAVAAVAYWWSFAKDVGNRYRENLEKVQNMVANDETRFKGWSERALRLVSKAVALGGRHRNVFLSQSFELNMPAAVTRNLACNEYFSLKDSWNVVIDEEKPKEKTRQQLWAEENGVGTVSVAATPDAAREQLIADASAAVERNLDRLEKELQVVLPPKAKFFKAEISYAAAVWPITLISLLVADFIRHLVDVAFEYFRGFLDKVSKSAFGEFNVHKV